MGVVNVPGLGACRPVTAASATDPFTRPPIRWCPRLIELLKCIVCGGGWGCLSTDALREESEHL
jgi:hypothetical protein